MQKYANNYADRYGNGIAGALITVTSTATGLPVTIYTDNGITPAVMPVTDALGQFAFYVEDGDYNITLSKTGLPDATLTDVSIKNPVAEAQIAAPDGAALVGFTASGAGAVARSALDKLREQPHTPYDFGALGGGADDYSALQAAFDHCRITGRVLALKEFFHTSQTIAVTVNNSQSLTVIGEGFGKSGLRKLPGSPGAILRIGSPAATSFTPNVDLRDFTIEGAGANDTTIGLELYDVVQSRFRLRCRQCDIGLKSYGGISLDFAGSDLSSNHQGAFITKFTSLAGGGWPNIFNFNNSNIKDNTKHGIYFDYGRVLNITGADIETNGTSGDLTTGGIWIGPNIGQEDGVAGPGLAIEGSWVEANAGRGGVVWESGLNAARNVNFVANANAVNDVYVGGGKYSLQDCKFGTNKPANIAEGAGVGTGNLILSCNHSAATIDSAKTVVFGTAGLENVAILALTLIATGQVSLGGAAGGEAFRAKTQAGAVNRVFAKGGAAGAPAQFGVEGEANASWYGVVAGTGIWQFTTGGGAYEQVRITNTTNATRALILTGGTVDAFISSTAGGVRFGAVPKLPTFTVAGLPAAASNLNGLVYVSDGTTNKRLAICDGTNWRFPDGAIVS